jgi:hypothetical protein
MGSAFDKDGAGTFVVEMIPGGGFVTAPFHLAAGNNGHAAAAVAGAVLDVAIPGVGGKLARAAIAGSKGAVAKVAVKGGAKAAIKGVVKVGVRKGVNAIHKQK